MPSAPVTSPPSVRPLLITEDPLLLDSLLRLVAAAGAEAVVLPPLTSVLSMSSFCPTASPGWSTGSPRLPPEGPAAP
jgi:hypothetical protein